MDWDTRKNHNTPVQQVSSFSFAQKQGKLKRLSFFGVGWFMFQGSCSQCNQTNLEGAKRKQMQTLRWGGIPKQILSNIHYKKGQSCEAVTHYASSVMPASKHKSISYIPARFLFSQRGLLQLVTWIVELECKLLILSSNGYRFHSWMWDTNSHLSVNENEERFQCSDRLYMLESVKEKMDGFFNLRNRVSQHRQQIIT